MPGAPASYLRYAYHFDAALYAQYLRRYAEQRGVKRVEGKVCEVIKAPETGDLTGVRLENGKTVTGQFFFDCTGFRSLLLSQALEVPWVDWRHWLPCDRALRSRVSTTVHCCRIRDRQRSLQVGSGAFRRNVAPETATSIAVTS